MEHQTVDDEQTTLDPDINNNSNLIFREKRVRKPKQFDNDYVLFNNTTNMYSLNGDIKNKLNIGDLVWAKLSGHPWWPCMVSNAPNSTQHYRSMGISRPKRYVYVEFYGPAIEHAWISEPSLIEYKGVDAFKIYAQDQVDQATAKSAKEKLADKFQLKVSLAKRDQWEKAVNEADDAIQIAIDERIKLFNKKLANSAAQTDAHLFDDEDSQLSVSSQISSNRKRNSSGDLISDLNDTRYKKSDFNENSNDEQNEEQKINTTETNRGAIIQSMILKNDCLISSNNNKCDELDDEDLNHNLETENIQISKERDEDENDAENITLSKILQDVANNKCKEDEYFDNITDKKENTIDFNLYPMLNDDNERKKRAIYINGANYQDEDDEEGQEEDDDDASFNSEDIEEEDTSDENYSDVEKINKKKQSINPRIKTPVTNLTALIHQEQKVAKRSDVINAFGLRQRTKTKRLKDHDDANAESDTSISSTGSLLIYQPDHNNVKKPKRTYNKTGAVKKYKTKKNSTHLNSSIESLIVKVNDDVLDLSNRQTSLTKSPASTTTSTAETYLIDRYKYAVRHIRQGLSVEEACNKYRISKGALLKCLSGGTAPRGKKTRLTELEENEIVEWLINNKDLKYNEAIHLVFEQVEQIFQLAKRPNPFHNGKPSMDWWYDFLSRHPQIMASKPEWLRRGKVNDQYIRDVQSGKLRCTKFRRALLSAIQYIRSLTDAAQIAADTAQTNQATTAEQLFTTINSTKPKNKKTIKDQVKQKKSFKLDKTLAKIQLKNKRNDEKLIKSKYIKKKKSPPHLEQNFYDKENKLEDANTTLTNNAMTSTNNNYLDRLVASLISDYADISENEDDTANFTPDNLLNCLQHKQKQTKVALNENNLINSMTANNNDEEDDLKEDECEIIKHNQHFLISSHNTNIDEEVKIKEDACRIKHTSSNHLLVSDDQDDEEYHILNQSYEHNFKNDYQEQDDEEEQEDEDEEEEDSDEEDEDGQTHITTLNEFA